MALLAGSFCPHYDSEARRRPLYQQLVGAGAVPPGIACDDGAAAHYIDDELAEIVADRAEAKGYLVVPGQRRRDRGDRAETTLLRG